MSSSRSVLLFIPAFFVSIAVFGSEVQVFDHPVADRLLDCTHQLATADVNGDGKLDVVSMSDPSSAGSVHVLVAIGHGDGTFEPCRDGATLSNPIAPLFRDLDGDGRADLVAVLGQQSKVVVEHGNGDGTFTVVQQIDTPEGDEALAVGDIDGDGKPDIVATGVSTLVVYRQTGSGFVSTGTVPITWSPGGRILIADLNGDGRQDVVINHGGGSWYAGAEDAIPGPPQALPVVPSAIADLNGDGVPDFVAAQSREVWIGSRSGNSFTVRRYTSFSSELRQIADVNGDGKPDLVGTDRDDTIVALGKGDGTFSTAWYFGTLAAVGDLNGDGRTDLLTYEGVEGGVAFIPGTADGALALPRIWAPYSGDFDSRAYLTGDINGDGRPDVVISGVGGGFGISLNRGDGTFSEPTAFAIPPQAGAVSSLLFAVADFDGDGRLDVVVGRFIALGNGDGTFTLAARALPLDPAGVARFFSGPGVELYATDGKSTEIFSIGPGRQIANTRWPVTGLVGDVDRDGFADIVQAVQNFNGVSATPSLVDVFYSDGDGSYRAVRRPLAAGLTQIADMDGDGFPELVVRGGLMVRAAADGSFLVPELPAPVRTLKFWADVDRDGRPDAILVNGIALARDDGTFAPGPARHDIAAVADFDGDGRSEGLFAAVHGFYVLSMRAVTTGTAPTTVSVSGAPGVITYGVSFNPQVTVKAPNGLQPNGFLTVSEGGKPLLQTPVVYDITPSAYVYLVAGTHSLTYTYSGDAVYAPSSTNVAVTVRKIGQLPNEEGPNMTFTGLFTSQPMTATSTFGIAANYIDFAPLQGQMTVFLDGHPVATRPMSSLAPQSFGSLAVTDTFPASPAVHQLKWVWPGDSNHIDINYGPVTFDRTPAAWDADHSTLTVTKIGPDTYDVRVQVRDTNGNALPDFVLGLAVTITYTGGTLTIDQAASTQSYRKATLVWKPRSPTDTAAIGTLINTGTRLFGTTLVPFTRSVVLSVPSKPYAVPR